jgi:hypothetical protein
MRTLHKFGLGFFIGGLILLWLESSAYELFFGIAILLFTIDVFLWISQAVKEQSRVAFIIGWNAGFYLLAGILGLAFVAPWFGYIFLVLGIIIVMYGLWLNFSYEAQEESPPSFTRPASTPSKPAVDDNDPLGVLPYADSIRPRTDGESKTSR